MAVGWLDPVKGFSLAPAQGELTQDQIDQRRRMAMALMQQGSQTGPVGSAWEGAARMANALVGAYGARKAEDAETANNQYNSSLLGNLFSGGGNPAPQSFAPTAQTTGQGGGQAALPGDVATIISSSAQKYGVDPAALQAIAQVESGGRADAKNPNSSAGGLFQFVDGTAKQYGLENKFDPVQASDAAARLAADNQNVLRNALGRDPTAGELYLAHQQGAGGAVKLLTNPNARASDVVGSQAVKLNGGNENMTAGEFASKWTNKVNNIVPQGPAQTSSVDGGGQAMVNAATSGQVTPNPNPTVAEAVIGQTQPSIPSVVQQQQQVAANNGYVDGQAVPQASQPQPQVNPVAQALAIRAQAGAGDQMVAGADQTAQPTIQELQSAGIQPQGAQAYPPTPQAPNPLQQAQSVIADPRASPQTKQVAMGLIQQAQAQQQAQVAAQQEQQQWLARQEYETQQKQNDPAYQLGLQKTQAELDAMKNPVQTGKDRYINAGERGVFDTETQKYITPPQGSTDPDTFKNETSLRKEFVALPSYKSFTSAAPVYESMVETADRDTKASDLNLVYGLGKIMDPGSVVREGEMVMVNNTGSLPDWLTGAINSVNGGARLTPETRQAILREAYGRMQGYKSAIDSDIGFYKDAASRYGLNVDNVLPKLGELRQWTPASKEPAAPDAEGWQTLPNGVKMRVKQ